jgi:hypothetical protein
MTLLMCVYLCAHAAALVTGLCVYALCVPWCWAGMTLRGEDAWGRKHAG